MNILQIEKFYFPLGGAPKYVLELSDLLRAAGDGVVPFAAQDKRNLVSPYSGYFVSPLDVAALKDAPWPTKLKVFGRMLYFGEAKRKLEMLLDDAAIDVAHLHNIGTHISPAILPVLKRRKIPVVMTLHDYALLVPNYTFYHHGAIHEEDARGWHSTCIQNKCHKNNLAGSVAATVALNFHTKIWRCYERYVDVFLAPSEFIRQKFVEYGWDARRIVTVPLPVVVPPLPRYSDGSYVLYLGRLTEEKGVLILLQAAARLREVRFVIAGEGNLKSKLQAIIRENNLTNVELAGFVQGAAWEELVTGARLVVVPSVWYENYPLSVLEAKARGKVVVASAIGGLPEMLPSELLVPSGDAGALADRIRQWYSAPLSERERMGQKLHEDVARNNNPERHVAQIRDIYKKLKFIKL